MEKKWLPAEQKWSLFVWRIVKIYVKYVSTGKNIGKVVRKHEMEPEEAQDSTGWKKHQKWVIHESKCWARAAVNAHLLFQSGYLWKQDPVSSQARPGR